MQEQNSEFLVFDHVTKRFGALTAVNDVSFSVGKGEFFSLLGPSGCGKTTLLRMLGGFERPDCAASTRCSRTTRSSRR